MAINFDALPSDKPFSNPEAGTYIGLIEKAEMKQPKDSAKKPYLNLQIALTNKDGKKCGKIFDILAESEHNLVQYKLKRFVTALGLPIRGSFELKDLTKIVVGKQLILDVMIDEKGDRPRAVVDVLKAMVYYPISEAQSVFGQVMVGEQDLEIFGSDAEDNEGSPYDAGDTEY